MLISDLITVTINLWKSEKPVSETKYSRKQFALLLKNRSMHDEFEGFFKQVRLFDNISYMVYFEER